MKSVNLTKRGRIKQIAFIHLEFEVAFNLLPYVSGNDRHAVEGTAIRVLNIQMTVDERL